MSNQNLLGVEVKNQSKSYILEQVQKHIHNPYAFFHIVSFNPENKKRCCDRDTPRVSSTRDRTGVKFSRNKPHPK